MGFQTAGEVILSFGNSNKTISKLTPKLTFRFLHFAFPLGVLVNFMAACCAPRLIDIQFNPFESEIIPREKQVVLGWKEKGSQIFCANRLNQLVKVCTDI